MKFVCNILVCDFGEHGIYCLQRCISWQPFLFGFFAFGFSVVKGEKINYNCGVV